MRIPRCRQEEEEAGLIVLAMVSVLLGVVFSVAAEDRCPNPPEDLSKARIYARKWFDRGSARVLAKDYEAAAAAFQCANSLVAHPATLLNLANVLNLSGDPEHAIEIYESFLETYPEHAKAAAVEAEIERLKEAVEYRSVAPTPTAPKSRNIEESASLPLSTDLETEQTKPDVAPQPLLPTPSSFSSESSIDKGSMGRFKPLLVTLLTLGGVGVVAGAGFQIVAVVNYKKTRGHLWLYDFNQRKAKYESFQLSAIVAFTIGGMALISSGILYLVGKSHANTIDTSRYSFGISPNQIVLDVRF